MSTLMAIISVNIISNCLSTCHSLLGECLTSLIASDNVAEFNMVNVGRINTDSTQFGHESSLDHWIRISSLFWLKNMVWFIIISSFILFMYFRIRSLWNLCSCLGKSKLTPHFDSYEWESVHAPAKGLKMEVLGNNMLVKYLDLREMKLGGLIITQQIASYFVLFICCYYGYTRKFSMDETCSSEQVNMNHVLLRKVQVSLSGSEF
jgi:hypothetical protein